MIILHEELSLFEYEDDCSSYLFRGFASILRAIAQFFISNIYHEWITLPLIF
jgi:hypothetical protein